MKLFLPTLSILSLVPSSHAWMMGPSRYYGGLAPMVSTWNTPTVKQLLREQQALMDQASCAWRNSNPRCEITSDDDKLQISLDVPGVQSKDLDVQLNEDGSVLSIRGNRSIQKENGVYQSTFSQSFSVDPTVNVEKLTAQLENGVLVVTAPKDLKKLEEGIRRIAVMDAVAGTESVSTDNIAVEKKGEASDVNELQKDGEDASSEPVAVKKDQVTEEAKKDNADADVSEKKTNQDAPEGEA